MWELTGGGVLIRKGRQVWSPAGQTSGTRSLGGTPSKQPIAVLRHLQGQSQSLNVTQKGCSPGARSSKEENLSAHPTSIFVPAAANVKWIQHFPSHYHIILHWPDPIGSNQPANQPALPLLPPAFHWSYFLIMAIWSGSLISLLFQWFFMPRCLFDYTVLNHFKCFFYTPLIAICVV